MDIVLAVTAPDVSVSGTLVLWNEITFQVHGVDFTGKDLWLHIADGRRPIAWQRQRLVEPEQVVVTDDVGEATVTLSTGACQGLFSRNAESMSVWLGLWDATGQEWYAYTQVSLMWAPQPHSVVPLPVAEVPATERYVQQVIADITGNAKPSTPKVLPVDADGVTLWDSAASWVGKFLSWSAIKATLKEYFDTLYAADDDSRLTDARTPTAHAAIHATGQADALTAANIGAETAGAVTTHNGAAAAHPFSAADRYRYGGTAGATTEGTITAAGRAILDDADAAAQRDTLSAYRDQTPAAAANVTGAAVAPDFAAALTLQWTLTGNVTSLATATNLDDGETGEIIVTIGSYALPADPPSGAYKGAWTVTGARVRIIIEQVGEAQYWTADSLEVVA